MSIASKRRGIGKPETLVVMCCFLLILFLGYYSSLMLGGLKGGGPFKGGKKYEKYSTGVLLLDNSSHYKRCIMEGVHKCIVWVFS